MKHKQKLSVNDPYHLELVSNFIKYVKSEIKVTREGYVQLIPEHYHFTITTVDELYEY